MIDHLQELRQTGAEQSQFQGRKAENLLLAELRSPIQVEKKQVTLTLFRTVIGSHAWRMEHPGSDRDIFEAYMCDTKDILRGVNTGIGSHFSQQDGVDRQSSEIGVVVNQLVKNNLNYIVNVSSPIVEHDPFYLLPKLRELCEKSLNRNLYHSFRGMAIHNYNKHIKDHDGKVPEHRLNKVARVIALGIKLLEKGPPVELAPYSGATKTIIADLIRMLDNAHRDSVLPEKCPNEDEMRDWLLKLRLRKLGREQAGTLVDAQCKPVGETL